MAPPTPVIYLDVDDEITSAAARIRGVEARRVALVVPPGSRVATSRINFRLLAREAQSHGRTLSIVAPDAASRALAAAAGLDVYASVAEFEEAAAAGRAGAGTPPGGAGAGGAAGGGVAGVAGEAAGGGAATSGAAGRGTGGGARPPRGAAGARAGSPETPGAEPSAGRDDLRARSGVAGLPAVGGLRRGRWGGRNLVVALVVVLAAVAVVGGVVLYQLLPTATIVVTPKVEAIGPIEVDVTADPNATGVDTAAGVVPAESLPFDVQAEGTYKATGQRVVEAKATGSVTFTNCDFLGGVQIGSGSHVATAAGVQFTTNETLLVPAADFQPPNKLTCATREVGVTAVHAGTDGNVSAGAITVVPLGVDPRAVSVSNSQPTSGGKHDTFPKVTQGDVDAAQADLQQQLGAAFTQDLASPDAVPAGTTLFPDTADLGPTTFSTDPASLVGQEIVSFDLGASATGTATAVDEAPVTTIAADRLRQSVSSGYDLVDGSIQTTVGTPTVTGKTVTFPTTATAAQIRQLDAASLKQQVLGLTVDQATQLLLPYGGVQITTWPDWASSIPSYGFRVDLTVSGMPAPSVGPSPAASGSPAASASPGGSSASPGASPSPAS